MWDMGSTAFTSSMSHRRIARARAWLKARDPAEELLIIGGSLDAANELARVVVQTSGSAFGWHRFTLAQLAAVLAAPTMAARGIVPIGRTDWPGILAIATETATSCSAPTPAPGTTANAAARRAYCQQSRDHPYRHAVLIRV